MIEDTCSIISTHSLKVIAQQVTFELLQNKKYATYVFFDDLNSTINQHEFSFLRITRTTKSGRGGSGFFRPTKCIAI